METQQTPQPFCIVPTGLPPLTTPSSVPNPRSYIYTLPTTRHYNHVVVFLVPGIELPPNEAAAVYISLPSKPGEFKFLGGIGPGKESAIFKISGLTGNASSGGQEVDMDGSGSSSAAGMPEITLGISIESAESVAAQIAAAAAAAATSKGTPSSNALVLASAATSPTAATAAGLGPEVTVRLARRIIKNAFNFLASFSGNTANGIEVVPLKAFEEWWRKFEGRVVRDPGFLERGEEGD